MTTPELTSPRWQTGPQAAPAQPGPEPPRRPTGPHWDHWVNGKQHRGAVNQRQSLQPSTEGESATAGSQLLMLLPSASCAGGTGKGDPEGFLGFVPCRASCPRVTSLPCTVHGAARGSVCTHTRLHSCTHSHACSPRAPHAAAPNPNAPPPPPEPLHSPASNWPSRK